MRRNYFVVMAISALVYIVLSIALDTFLGRDINETIEFVSYRVVPVALASGLGTFVRDRRLARRADRSKR